MQIRVIASISSPSILIPIYNSDFHWGKASLVMSRDSFHSRYCLICIVASNKDKIYSIHMIVVCFYLMVTFTFSRSADGWFGYVRYEVNFFIRDEHDRIWCFFIFLNIVTILINYIGFKIEGLLIEVITLAWNLQIWKSILISINSS